jgi:hypothetical protein
MEGILEDRLASNNEQVYQIMEEGWKTLAELRLPNDHPLYTPLGFLFTEERKEVIRFFAIVCSA